MKHLIITATLVFFIFCTSAQTVINNPKHGLSTATGLRMEKIEMTESATIISFHAMAKPGVWISVPDKTYILPVYTTDTLYITKTENIPLNKRYTMTESGYVDYKAFFPPVDKDVAYIDFGESNPGGNWRIYNIPLKIIKSPIPEHFAGNWFDHETGEWLLSLLDNASLYKGKVWSYTNTKLKKKKGTLELTNEEESILLKFKRNKTGTIDLLTETGDLKLLTRKSNGEPKQKHELDEGFKTPLFKSDSATYKGYIAGYTPRAGFKTISVSVNDILTGSQNKFVARIQPDGQFKIKLPLYYPHLVFVRSEAYNGSIFLEPGKSVFHYIGRNIKGQGLLCMGESDQINSDLYKMRNLYGPDYTKIRNMVLDMSQSEYKTYLLDELEKQLQTLEKLKLKKNIGEKAYQVKKYSLTYRFYSKLFEYRWDYESAYRKKNKVPRSQRRLDITIPDAPENYYDFVTPELCNDPLAPISTDYGSFVNRLKYSSILRTQHQPTTTYNIISEMKESGYKFSDVEMKFVKAFEKLEEIKKKTEQTEYKKKYKKKNEAFNKKYRTQLSEIYRERNKKDLKTPLDIKQALINNGVKFSPEEIELLNANKKFQNSDLGKQLTKASESIKELSNQHKDEYNNFLNEYFIKKREKEKSEKQDKYFGEHPGLMKDILNAQDICRKVVTNFEVLDDKSLLTYQTTFSTPFIGNYLEECNENTKRKIEANKLKSGYAFNLTPTTEADKIFDAIISKYKGKLIYVDFWATWCSPCRSGIERIKPLKEEMEGSDVVFLYITGASSPEKTYKNMIPDIKGEHYRLSKDEWNYICEKFNITGIPHYMLVNQEGKIINPKLGHLSNDALKKLFNKHL